MTAHSKTHNYKFFKTRYSAKKYCNTVGGTIQQGRAMEQGKIVIGFWVEWPRQ